MRRNDASVSLTVSHLVLGCELALARSLASSSAFAPEGLGGVVNGGGDHVDIIKRASR